MKKILSLLCMITCIFGLMACGVQETYSDTTIAHMQSAETLAENLTNFMTIFFDDAKEEAIKEENNAASIEYLFESSYEIYVDGTAVLNAVDSFHSGFAKFGNLVEIKELSSTADDENIYVTLEVVGEKKTGKVEMIFSNDYFVRLESATLNVDSTLSEKMTDAGLNTLLGMGTVFIVLILISLIISLFQFIPKLQNIGSYKESHNEIRVMKKAKKIKNTRALTENQEIDKIRNATIDKTIAQIIENEKLEDDLELVAVIAAAIAAFRGSENTEDFVVRSIRKSTRTKSKIN